MLRRNAWILVLTGMVLAAGCDKHEDETCQVGIMEVGVSCGNAVVTESCSQYSAADEVVAYCTADCQIRCGIVDLGWQTGYRDVEQTDALCSNGENDFKTVDKHGNISNWVDCDNYGCVMSPVVQVCAALENTDAACSDEVDNATSNKLPKGMQNAKNGLIDCKDPSCFKNPRVTVCAEEKPKWELGAACVDGIDNDGDTLMDCADPDCLHAGGLCELGGVKRVLFDNAHHQIAGSADWIIDVTGRHPYPSKPQTEDAWHGSLSSWGKDILDTGWYVVETLIQDRWLSYEKQGAVQDLSFYDILILVEPSAKYAPDEIQAIYQFVQNGGGLILFADHKGADRDGNNVDAVDAMNDLLKTISASGEVGNNPFGFSVAESSGMENDIAIPATGQAAHPIVQGTYGTVEKIGTYAGTVFQLQDGGNAAAILTTQSNGLPYVVAAQVGNGRVVAIGDSSIAGDATNMLGLTNAAHDAYHSNTLQNKVFLLNVVDWVAGQ